jgi:hypothetical protein
MTAAELLAARCDARTRAEQRYTERARVESAKYGLSLTCQDKPVEWHGTCVGLQAPKNAAGPINDGLGCLCPCHDPEPTDD